MGNATFTNIVYQRFMKEQVQDPYKEGDVYDDESETSTLGMNQAQWRMKELRYYPYLEHIKGLSMNWPHLRPLADFMEVSTHPTRWRLIDWDSAERRERASRTQVTQLEYHASGKVGKYTYNKSSQLKQALDEIDDQCQLRLFVVEDLSRDVIEALGDKLNIDPSFFRAHISDYAWSNVRDRWMDPPNLNVVRRSQPWFQLRYVYARYFKTWKSFQDGYNESKHFNIMRRVEDDANNKALFDDTEAIVGVTRSRATFWSARADIAQKRGAVGVLLLDPTIQEGKSLWYNYRNWEEAPGPSKSLPENGPPRISFYEDFLYWAQKPEICKILSPGTSTTDAHVPIQALLHLICAEWLTMAEYIKTRLNQIEWEISEPDHFLHQGVKIDDALQKLHFWRRVVPLYREMLTETLQRVFGFSCSTRAGVRIPMQPQTQAEEHGPIDVFAEDYQNALSYLEEYQARIDRLTSVVTAVISINDSRRGQNDARNVARLTWLATVFIPLSYMTGIFSMQEDVSKLKATSKIYVSIALPLAILSLGLGLVLTLPSVHRFWRTVKIVLIGGSARKKKQ